MAFREVAPKVGLVGQYVGGIYRPCIPSYAQIGEAVLKQPAARRAELLEWFGPVPSDCGCAYDYHMGVLSAWIARETEPALMEELDAVMVAAPEQPKCRNCQNHQRV